MKFLDRHMDDVKRKSSFNYLSNEKAKKLRSKFIHRVHFKKKDIFEKLFLNVRKLIWFPNTRKSILVDFQKYLFF